MRWLAWIVRLIVFFLVLALALKNTVDVPVALFFDWQWRAPLSVLLLSFLVAGSCLGVAALLPRLARLKRENARLKRRLRPQQSAASSQEA